MHYYEGCLQSSPYTCMLTCCRIISTVDYGMCIRNYDRQAIATNFCFASSLKETVKCSRWNTPRSIQRDHDVCRKLVQNSGMTLDSSLLLFVRQPFQALINYNSKACPGRHNQWGELKSTGKSTLCSCSYMEPMYTRCGLEYISDRTFVKHL